MKNKNPKHLYKKTKIRHMASQDRESVNNLLKIFNGLPNTINDELMEMLYRRRDTFAEVIIVEEGGKEKIVGFGLINLFPVPDEGGLVGKIEDMVTDPNYQGCGLGTKLCKCLIEIAELKKAKLIELTSNPKRIAARKLYKKLGFKKRETDVFELQL